MSGIVYREGFGIIWWIREGLMEGLVDWKGMIDQFTCGLEEGW